MKRLFKIFAIFIILLSSFKPNVKAANGYINVKSSSNTVIIGKTFTTTITISSTVALGSWEFSLNYNPALLKLESGSLYVADYGNGTIKSKSYIYTFKALASGTATVGVKSYAAYDWTEAKMSLTAGVSSIRLTTQEQIQASYSKNNNLSSLTIDKETLNPTFNKDTLNYTVELNPNTETITIKAKAEDYRSKIDGIGTKEVTEGENKFEVIVTAQNGSIKKYTINANVKDPNPIEVTTINNEKMTIVKRESLLKAPDGFIKNTLNINDILVPSLYNQENQLVLVGLKDKDGNINLYIYDSINKKYSPYIELTFNKLRILPLELKKDDKLFKNYKEMKTKINDIEIQTYKLNSKSEYAIFYGLEIDNSTKNYYKYDSKEKTLIRFENEEATILNKDIDKLNTTKNILIITNIITLALLITSISIIIIPKLKDCKFNKNSKVE